MANKVFRMFAAMTMLLLYVSVLAAGDVVALTCECRHHKADVHTDFAHVHACDDDCHHGEGESHDAVQLTDHRCCNHNHSNSIALYTQPRSADDDQQERQSVLMAVVTDVLDFFTGGDCTRHHHSIRASALAPTCVGVCSRGSATRPTPVGIILS